MTNQTRLIQGELKELIPINEFRVAHDLPQTFDTAILLNQEPAAQPLWQESTLLDHLASKMTHAIPPLVTMKLLPEVPDAIISVFRSELVGLSHQHALSLEEIDTAVLDLRDLLMPAVYRLVDLAYAYPGQPDEISALFDMVALIRTFLEETTFIGSQTFSGDQIGAPAAWSMQIIFDHFGPLGLVVNTGKEETYLLDQSGSAPTAEALPRLALPLGQAIAKRFIQNL